MTQAIIYCRQSKADKEADSLERQEIVCLKYCEEKNYEVVAVLKELPGTSGAKFDAEQLTQAIRAAKAGLYQVLVVRDIARFGRDRLKFELKTLELCSYNVTVEFVWQQFDNSPEGRLQKGMTVQFEEYRRSVIARELLQGRLDRVKLHESFLVHGNAPFGYEKKKEGKIFKLIINEFEAQIVRTIFRLYTIENYSLHEIARYLNENKTPTWSQLRTNSNFGDEDSEWRPSTIKKILTTKTYIGEWQYGKYGRTETVKIVDNEIRTIYERKKNEDNYIITLRIDPIIDEETWNLAQQRLDKNENLSGRPSKYNYLLARHVTCVCNAKMCGSRRVTSAGREQLYYHCPMHDARAGKVCSHKNMNTGKLDSLAWQWLEGILKDKDKLKKRILEFVENKDKELQPLYEEVSKLDEIISRRRKEYHKLVDLYLSSSDYGQQELLGRKLKLEQELQQDEAKRNELKRQLDELGKSVEWLKWYSEVYNSFDTEKEKRDFATMLSSTQNTLTNTHGDKAFGKEHINFQELADLTEDKELTFEEKRKYVERFNLCVKLLEEDKILVSCDFTQEILSLSSNSIEMPVQLPQFILFFSDILDFSTLPQFQQVAA